MAICAGGGADGGVVRRHALERLVLGVAFEERRLQLVKLAGDVVVLMKRRAGKDGGENVLGQDVLDQHLAHVGFREAGVDRLLGVLEKIFRGFSEVRLALVGAHDHGAQRFEDFWEISFELLDRLAKLRDLGALVLEE